MKRKLYYISILFSLSLLCACGEESAETVQSQEAVSASTEENQHEKNSRNEGTEEVIEEGIEEFTEESEETTSMVSILVENPSWDYILTDDKQTEAQPYELLLREEKANEITDTEEWFIRNGLTLMREESENGYTAIINNGGTGITISKEDDGVAFLDFDNYRYPEDYVKADETYIEETVHDARIADDILYVSVFHYTYAASAPANGYITAIDLDDYHVIWKSQPLVCNSLNFEIVGDVIFCGYGFTQEDDYLYQLDRMTGSVLGKTELKSKPDYLIYQDDKLYVRTYNTDYVYELETVD